MSDALTANNLNGGGVFAGAVPGDNSDVASLVSFSARIGRNPLLAQASSGNTSVKVNGTIWIKASGKWLAKAEQQNIFVPLRISECLEQFEGNRMLPGCVEDMDPDGLRPSIETFMHAVLPHRFVAHVHSVNTIAWAVRSDGREQLASRLSGFNWEWIPYVPSGLPLAREVAKLCCLQPVPEVLVLENHGLVVCGDTCIDLETLLFDVERRLAIVPRPVSNPDSGLLDGDHGLSSWILPDCDSVHTFAMDTLSFRIAVQGILYPCQAIFLGLSFAVLAQRASLSDQVDESQSFLIIEGRGVLVNSNISPAEYAVLKGLAEVVRRLDADAPLRYLTPDEVKTAVDIEGQRYRTSAEDSLSV